MEGPIKMEMWDKKILTVLLKWDYGQESRGLSGDKLWFFDSFEKLCRQVVPFWYDQYLDNLPKLQEDLLATVEHERPDLLFFLMFKDQFQFDTLDTLKTLTKTIAWFGDDTWRFDGYSSRYAPHFTYALTTDPWSVCKYKQLGVEAILTEWASAPPLSSLIGPLQDGENYLHEVSFVGGINKYRKWFIDRLSKQGIAVDCFGAGWPNGRVSFGEMEQIFRRSRINLNISNSVNHDIRFICSGPRILLHYLRSPKRAEQVKARNFEIPLAGGFQLSNYVPCLERHLEIGKEIAVYTTPEECAQQISYFLGNEEERRHVMEKGHARSIAEHTYEHRLAKILTDIFGKGTPTGRS